ncbi:MAG: hypothetical protein IJ740_09155 [Ruminococcus sp.]|nr:hypothetical protein [Ruminococcus sp.]
MATTSTADKLTKLEKKIAKRQATIAEEQKQLNKDMEEYDKLYLLALADKFKLKGKDLFSAIEREHEQLEKLRDGGMSDSDIDGLADNTPAEKGKANPYEESPRTLFDVDYQKESDE